MELKVGDIVTALESDDIISFGDTGTVEEDKDKITNIVKIKWDRDLSEYGYDDNVYYYHVNELSVLVK